LDKKLLIPIEKVNKNHGLPVERRNEKRFLKIMKKEELRRGVTVSSIGLLL
jgi:hypothetical protein